jgi:hypothetical protein
MHGGNVTDNIDKSEYRFAVHIFSRPTFRNSPEFTHATRTEESARQIVETMKLHGLESEIVSIEKMKGVDPYYEKEL